MPTVNSVIAERVAQLDREDADDERADDDEQPTVAMRVRNSLQDVLHAVEDPLALLDRRARAANESSIRTRSATPRVAWLPLPIAMPRLRLLERQHVVDAVADHRHVVAAARAAPRRAAPSAAGVMRPKIVVSLGGLARTPRRRARRAPGPATTPRLRAEAGLPRQRRDRVGVVAGDDLDGDAGLRGTRASVSAASARSSSLQGDEAERPRMPVGQGAARRPRRRAARLGPRATHEQHAQALRRVHAPRPVSTLAQRRLAVVAVARQRPQERRARRARRSRAATRPRAGERRPRSTCAPTRTGPPRASVAARAGQRRGDRLARLVARRVRAGGERPTSRGDDLVLVAPPSG